MNAFRYLRALLFVCCLTLQHPSVTQQIAAPHAIWQVYFSPRGGASSAIVQTIDNAKSTVLVQAYSFTSEPIVEALVRAYVRGVKVQVLLDRSQRTQKYAVIEMLIQAGIPTMIDAAHAIAHNKVMIIDSQIIVTGSFNFTKAAEERNAENLLIIRNGALATFYIENWRLHRGHSLPFFRQNRR